MSNTFDSIIVFGEVLFDVFPDQSRVIGGAPFNVACHLNGFGLDPVFISRIGNDDSGKEVLRKMDSRAMSVSGLQQDEQRMTGQVMVRIDNHEPSYDIKNDVAYDHIEPPDSKLVNFRRGILLYHGTLSARNKVSATTLYRLAQKDNTTVFCDINLRDPWWNKGLVSDILAWSDYLKVNENELRQVCFLEGIDISSDLQAMAESLRKKRNFKCLIVTLGSKGAMLFPSGASHAFVSSPEVENFQDSVGAGDAFSSVFLLGITKAWTWQQILERAVFFAARICENKGAVPDDLDFYQQVIKRWEKGNA
jgi:fructokinase